MPRRDLTNPAFWTAILALVFIPACGEKESVPSVGAGPGKLAPAEDARASKDVSKKIESFTGARTKIVWSQHVKDTSTDPRSNNASQHLMGLDSRDGRGARAILAKEDNYTRPILTADGDTILYTRKSVTWDAQDGKHYSVAIMRADWKGGAPVEISDGYAVDTWVDPDTRIEWVYAVRDIMPSPLVSLEAKKLVRFQLSHPKQEELVWDQTRVSPDNIQFSRDGQRASGQFPWPDSGQFILDGRGDFKKHGKGAWPSIAPDNSYVSWILDDRNQGVTLFADDNRKPWSVALTTTPELAKGEVCHPCWSNHPRFITLTGPYLPAADPSEGSAISKGGLTSEVFIGKFSEKLERIEGWLRITENALNDIYPDVWIEGGDTAELQSFVQTHDAKPASPMIDWPPSKDGAVFLWEIGSAKNTVTLPGGRELDCGLDMQGAARYGRSYEMLLDAGTFVARAEAAGIVSDALQSAMPLSVEFILRIDGDVKSAFGTLATFPHLRLSLRDGIISAETSAGIIGVGPVRGSVSHVTASAGDTGYSLTLQEADGKSMTKISAAKPRRAQGRSLEFSFGGGNGRDVGISHAAVYARKLPAGEIQDHARALSSLPVPTLPATLKLRGKLVQTSTAPAAESIGPDKNAFIESVYEVTKVVEGGFTGKQILVKHWGMMNGKPSRGFPRKVGLEYDLLVQPFIDHPQFKGIRSVPIEGIKDLDAWHDISTPAVAR